MNEINIKLTAEQVANLNKILSPYVELYASINRQFREQSTNKIISGDPTPDDIEEISRRR